MDRNQEDLLMRLNHLIKNSLLMAAEEPDALEKMDLNLRWANEKYAIDPVLHISNQKSLKSKIKKIIKRFFRKTLTWYTKYFVSKQNEFNSFVVGYLNEDYRLIRDFMMKFEQFSGVNDVLIEIHKNYEVYEHTMNDSLNKVWQTLDNKLEEIKNIDSVKSSTNNNVIANILIELSLTQNTIANLYENIEKIKKNTESLENRLSAVELKSIKTDESLKHELSSMKENLLINKSDIEVAISALRSMDNYILNMIKTNKQSGILKFDNNNLENNVNEYTKNNSEYSYLEFENLFRGDEVTIKNRQSEYLKFIKTDGKVVDLGCGRGEFLSVLKEHGYQAVGVEINQDMFTYCKHQGLDVTNSDMFEFMQDVEDSSLSGVSLNQVVEHLSNQEFQRITAMAFKKLKPNGVLFIETQNPRSLAIFNNGFYIDPTHNKPVHPFTVEFICENIGFSYVETHYLSPYPEELKIPHIKGGIDNMQEVNIGIDRLNEALFGPQDYVVVAYK